MLQSSLALIKKCRYRKSFRKIKIFDEKNKAKFIPSKICPPCLNELSNFAIYRKKLVLTLRFMEAMVDLKGSNSKPLSELFKGHQQELTRLFKDLALCNKEEPLFDDLVGEFDSYSIAAAATTTSSTSTMTTRNKVKKELIDHVSEPEDDDDDDFRDVDFECPNNSDDDDIKPQSIFIEPPKVEMGEQSDEEKEEETPKKKRKGRPKGTTGIPRVKKEKTEGSSPKKTGKIGRPRIHPEGNILKEQWSCDKCKFKTKYRIAVDRHKDVHYRRENRVYPCTECGAVFKTYDEMKSHSSLHPENQVICDICGASLKSTHSLKAHMERHDESTKYTCEYCDYVANTKIAMKSHLSIHTKENNKRCEICGMTFRTSHRLKRHMESHSNERKYACEQCPARFNTANAMRNHHTRVHIAIRYPCEHCDKTFDQKIILRDHMERVHQIQCHFICDICVITFDAPEKLETHKFRHENPKPLECSVCLTLHKTQEDFDNHMCISYRDDYLCCNKDLRNHVQYNRHMLVKHNIKTNFRVKPVPGVLLGQVRGTRKRLEQCRRCSIAFPSRALKLQHMAICNQTNADGQRMLVGNNI